MTDRTGTLADDERVAAVRAFIRDRLSQANAGLLAIGNHILDEFFDGDPEKYSAHGRSHAGLRALLRGTGTLDLPLSKTALSNAIQLAVVTRQLGERSRFAQLPQSVAIEVLPLRDVHAIELLAIDIEMSEMTVRQVRELVRDMRPKTGIGRSRKPALLRAVDALTRILGQGPSCQVVLNPGEVAALDPQKRERAYLALGQMRDHLNVLHEALGVAPEDSSDVGTPPLTEREPQAGAHTSSDRRSDLATLVSVL